MCLHPTFIDGIKLVRGTSFKVGETHSDAVNYHVVGCYECGGEGELTCSCTTRVNIPMALELALIDKLLSDQRTDARRLYVTGISMGGYGTWDIICRRPQMFAAAMPICGGGDTAQAAKIAKVPIWVFHGSADGAVPVFRSRSMVSALWAAGSNAHYREYPDAGHNVWTRTYRDDEVLKWFFSQRNKRLDPPQKENGRQ